MTGSDTCVIKLENSSIISNRSDALDKNQDLEFERNKERFAFLKVCAVIVARLSFSLSKRFLLLVGGAKLQEYDSCPTWFGYRSSSELGISRASCV